jgi:serine/threonine protein kinase/dipeptidyl aminopeptidase/acylaminoacyl peptidase
MSLGVGSRVGPYDVLASLGAGAMGEVYRARDSRLNRDVAIKILPDLFAADPERLARFMREAQALAALNHPNIAQIHGLEESAGGRALVMELVEGEDLAERIGRGPVALDEALPIARQIASALEAAHEQGIVHRDLKPANVRVRPDGTVKVLDFGLAKALDPPGAATDPMKSPTLTARATLMGMIVGTAAYMSPEQAKGRPIDRRTDIWAFGCVLYELLTGSRAFPGDALTDTIARVLEREPDWTLLPAGTPAYVRELLQRCLRKDPARRLRDIGDARLQLEDGSAMPVDAAAPPSRSTWLAFAAIGCALLVGAAIGWTARPTAPASPRASRPVRLDLLLPSGFELFTISGSPITISPDGATIAFVAGGRGTRQVFLRRLDASDSTPLRGTEAAVAAFFGADDQTLGVLSRDRAVKRISLGDGLVTDVTSYVGLNAPVWGNVPVQGADRAMVFSRDGLWRVMAAGEEPARLTTLDASRGELAHLPGVVLPSGVVLFTSWTSTADRRRIEAVNPEDGARRVVVDRASSPLLSSATGHLLFHRDGAMLAAPFDVQTVRVTGEAVTVIPPGAVRWAGGIPVLALSASGSLVYAPAQTGLTRLVRVSRDGTFQPLMDAAGSFSHPRVSPEGSRVVLEHAADSLWVQDLTRDARSPLTSGLLPGVGFPIWTRDGRRVVFRRADQLWWVDASGSGRTGRVPSEPADIPVSLSPDGEVLAVLRTSASGGGDLVAISPTGAWSPRPLVQTQGYDGGADFSPDGRWLLYASTDSGTSQVYLAPYPAMDRKWAISTRGGTQPRWSRSGREAIYRNGDQMMAVGVETSGAEPRLSTPRVLFERTFASGAYVTIPNYDVMQDGSFVMMLPEPGVPRLTVVLDWIEELRAKVGAR